MAEKWNFSKRIRSLREKRTRKEEDEHPEWEGWTQIFLSQMGIANVKRCSEALASDWLEVEWEIGANTTFCPTFLCQQKSSFWGKMSVGEHNSGMVRE